MERFSISIICQQVYNICRLCGVDNPDKIPIIGAEAEIFITESDEPTLVKKIEQCVGIKVDLMDQMPQQICSLCVDKVNDFFEYRSMCEAINIQTRRFLNLPLVQPPIPTSKPIKVENVVIALDDDDDEVDTKPIDKRGPKTRNRKKQPEKDVPGSGEEVDSKSFLEGPSEKRFKYDHPCQYCNESYSQSSDLERHLVVKHTPLVHKFGCGSCMEYFETATEYKDHNLWHKLTRTSFGCVRCNRKFVKISTLNKHVSLNACIRRPYVSYEVTLVPDMQCSLCFKVFKTRNLYEWHGCFLRSRANCPKCGKHFLKKNLLIRHYMLYCNGTNPLLEPIVIPKDEPGSGTVNNIPHGGTEKRKRGRPSAARAAADMKEETIDLPFPALLDLPDPKSETNSIADGHMSPVEGTVSSGNEMVESQRRSSLMEETKKITTLLRSGESVDGNTDINTINSMLSSVNEAIATISKVRKKKKKRDRLSSSGAGNVSEGTETSNPPMVVLSMANVKQEVQENSVPLAPTDSAGLVNGLSEAVRGGNVDQRGVDSSASNSLADRNHNAGDSDSDVEIISVEQYQAVNSETIPVDANGDDTMGGNNTRSHETDIGSEPMIQVKREPLAIDDEDESDFEGYEDASMYVAVKQEPVEEETVEPVSFDQHSAATEKQSEPSFSSFQALRIKIKKEKGLLNASVVGEDGSTDTASTLVENSSNEKRQTGAVVREKKTPKDKSAKRGSNPPPVKRCLRTSTMSVSIKQEPIEHEEQPLERVSEPEQHYPAEGNEVFDATVRIKQEPQEEDTPPSDEDDEQMHSADQVAFDGMRIKRERADDEPASHKRHASSKAINPLSLTGVRIAGGHKKSANSQPGVSAHKSSKRINPFALLKQKESVSSVAEQESGSRDSEPAAAGPSKGFGLPVITQVQSIDPVEHLSLTQVDAVAAESTNEALEQQKEITAEMDDTDNLDRTDSVTQSEPPCNSKALAMDTNNVPSEEDVGGLRITSVTTIPEDSVSSQANSTLREPNIATITHQDSSSELKITSVTTIPPPESNSELKITSVTTIPEDMVQGCSNQEPYDKQQISADDADQGDSTLSPADESELLGTEDLIQQPQVPNDTETTSSAIVNELTATLDSGKLPLEDDDEQVEEQEKQVVSTAPQSSEDLLEDKAGSSTNELGQMATNHDTVTAETSDNIEPVTETAERVITTETDKVITATCTEEPEKCPVGEVPATTQKEHCVVANNDAVLVAKQ